MPRQLRGAETLARAARGVLNTLLFDSLLDAPETLPRFFAEFGELEGTEERHNVCLFVEFWVQWIAQLPFLGLFLEFHKSGRFPQFLLRTLRLAFPRVFRVYPRGSALRHRNRSDFWHPSKQNSFGTQSNHRRFPRFLCFSAGFWRAICVARTAVRSAFACCIKSAR